MKSKILPTIFSLVIAGLFLFFAFRNIDLKAVWTHLRRVSWWSTGILFLLQALGMFLRGWRWWYTFPKPQVKGEFLAAQQALAIGYALNNAAPRLGELGRILVASRATGRGLASLTSTVVLDRFLFDLLMVMGLFIFAMVSYQTELEGLLPSASQYFLPLVLAFLGGCLALVLVAVKPDWIRRVLCAIGVSRISFIWPRIDALMDQLSIGFEVIKRPGTYGLIIVQTLLLWACYLAFFFYGLNIFGIQPGFSQGLMIYSVTMLGIILPSPGGVGTFHFFAQKSLIGLAGTEPALATACATYIHGVGYGVLIILGLIAFLWYRQSRSMSQIEVKPKNLDIDY